MVEKIRKYINITMYIVIVTMVLGCNINYAKVSQEKAELSSQSEKYLQGATPNSNLKEIKFEDTNLYNEIVSQISSYIYKKDDASKKVYIENANLNNIKALNLNDKRIIKTSGIENFTGLTTLNISSNDIDGLDYIAQIKSLKKLSISNCGINKNNIGKLNSLTNLQSLDIAVNKLYDTDNIDKKDSILGQINGLKNLKYLNASSNYIKNIEAVENFPNLKSLNLYDNNVIDLKGLEKLTNLEILNLGENNEIKRKTISNLGALKKLQNLRILNFSENYVNNIIDNVTGLTNLTELQLEKNNIKNISGIEKLTNLVNLNLCGNSITDVEKIAKLTKLEVVRLGNNDIKDISPLYDTKNNASVYNSLKKLDISANKNLKNNDALKYFCGQSQNKQIELDYEYITDTTNLPHYDNDGVAYVTYSDFGARCDGIYDDYIAMRNAHIYANSVNCEVRIKDTKEYHIFHYYGAEAVVETNTDLGNSNIIIHDEKIDTVSGRFNHLFKVTNGKDIKTISKPKWTIKKNQKNIPELKETLNELKEYSKFMCIAENANKKMFIRSGTNTNSGSSQKDIFCIDSFGNTLNDIQWDFDEITSITIVPVQKKEIIIKNGNFLSKAVKSGNEAHNSISGSGKPVYFSRGINIDVASNVKVLNINHKLEENDKISGSYRGFINANGCADLTIKDCNLVARKYLGSGRSTYDLNMNTSVNLWLENVISENINDSQRWGIVGSNFTKDITYKNCKLNRIDAHQGIYNLNIKNCTVGIKGLTLIGQGDLKIEGTSVESNKFIELRSDYGSTWNGNVYIDNCKYIHIGTSVPKFIQHTFKWEKDSNGNKKIHDYGYECKFPNLYVNNFTIDLKNSKDYNYMEIISNETQNYDSTYDYDYWPKDIHFNNYKFINNNTGKNSANIKFCAQKLAKKEGKDYNYSLTNCVINSNKQPVTLQCMKGIYKTTSPIDFSIDYIREGKNLATTYVDEVLSNKYSKFNVEKGNVINESLNSEEYERYKIVINSQVTEESGTYSGKAVFVLKQLKYNVEYSTKEITNKDVTVKITSNEEMQEIKGWTLSTDKKMLTKIYSENTNEEIEICDYIGNKIKKIIKINNIDKNVPVAEVSYSTTKPTNQDVVAVIKANEEMQEVEGWNLSADKKSMTKTYKENAEEKINIKDLAGNEVTANINISNIDKKAPTARVNYNTTGNNVTVTITVDEKVEQIEGWTIDETQTTLTKIFTENKEEKVVIKDLAGNTNIVDVKVTNIKQGEMEVNVEYSTTEITNKDVTVKITSNEEMQEIKGWTLSTDKKMLTKIYSENTNEEIEICDYIGNKIKKTIKINNIDKNVPIAEVNYSTTKPTNQDVVAVIKANEAIQGVEGWNLSADKKSMTKVYSENFAEEVIVKDLAGNEVKANVNISNIDKKAPTARVNYNTTVNNVTVTIIVDEKIEQIEGWTIDETQTTLTKIFTENKEEKVVIKDLAGNTNIVDVKVTNIKQEEIEAKVEYSTTVLTNQNTVVTIMLNKEIHEIEGWNLSEDKKVLTKIFDSNKEEELEIKDFMGNTKKVLVKVNNIDKIAPIIKVRYNTTNSTNKDVVATITANEEMQEIEGWSLSDDKKSMTKVYSENFAEEVIVKDLAGNEVTANVNISNIDKKMPTVQVNYNTVEGNVIVTITADKKIEQIEGWTIDTTQTVLTKIFTENKEEKVVIKDLAGNTNVVDINITSIEKEEIEARVEYSTTVLVNKNITVTITLNKEIQQIKGWTLSKDKKTLTKVFEANEEEVVEIQDSTGNTRRVLIKVANIDKKAPEVELNYSTTKPTNQNVIATITADEEMQEIEGWSLSEDKKSMTKVYSENFAEEVIVKDLAGNEVTANVNISNIDKKIPTVQVNYNTVEGNVIVTITADKKIEQIEGWTIDTTQTVLTKIFTENKEEKVVIKDLAGNTNVVDINITSIEKEEIETEIEYSTTVLTNQNVTVAIRLNKEIQPVKGWNLSENKKILTKIFETNEEEVVEIQDLAGNTRKVLIKVANIDKEAPIVEVTYSTEKTTDKEVTVTVKTNEEIQAVEGWSLAEDKKSMTKVYSKNTTETIVIQDLANNSTKVNIQIENIKEKSNSGDKSNFDKTIAKDILPNTSGKKIFLTTLILIALICSGIIYIKLKSYRDIK